MQKLSIIIPIYNEEENIQKLVERIHKACTSERILYEIIFVDDHSTDNTQKIIQLISPLFPISFHAKKGKQGKSYSLIEGFQYAKYELLCMIDADLQYAPEYIPAMVKMSSQADIIIAKRKEQSIPFFRKIMSSAQHFIFNKILHNMDYDVQSGLKVFKKEIVDRITLNPKPWTFDLEFLLKAIQAGYTISSLPIAFYSRLHGKSKINVLKDSWQIAISAIQLKFARHRVIPFHPVMAFKEGKGFHYNGSIYVHHSDLAIDDTAFFRLTLKQQVLLLSLAISFVISFAINWHVTIVLFLGALTFLYFTDLLFSLFLISRNFQKQTEIDVSEKDILEEKLWPMYTILCPLYKELQIIPQFIDAIQKIDYPKIKLQVMLLLEEDDTETINKAATLSLPSYVEFIIVPNSSPKTKPKALNYGLTLAKGDYVVIYDAEDIPDPMQLKKVVIAFEKSIISNKNIACIQAKLNFYNPHQNLLTRIFTAEYSLWFDLVLTGLQSLDAPIPLGGTSNHFRTKDIKMLKGWDSFNVTEDCDLGLRLAKNGFQTAMVNSTTLEEANSDLRNWFRQRGRWIKGYIQSYFVHVRHPKEFLEKSSVKDFILFQIIVGGKITSLFINPMLWAITAIYFIFRPFVGNIVESFFPSPIYYIGILSLVFGNFLYLYYYMIATIKREHFSITKYALLVPFYWLCMSVAAWGALYKMITQPYYWAKTVHGLHLKSPVVAQIKQNPNKQIEEIQDQTIVDIPQSIQPALS